MGNEISSDASNNVILKSKKMTNEELKNRIKLGEKYVQIHKNELKSRKGRTQVTYQPKSKTGNSKPSNKSNVASKPLEKKSKSGGKKPNPIKKITSLTYIQKKQKIVYIKKIIGEYDENELKKKANDINCNFPKKILDYSKEKRIIEMKKKIINCINRKKDNEVNLSIEELRIKTAVLKIHNSQN